MPQTFRVRSLKILLLITALALAPLASGKMRKPMAIPSADSPALFGATRTLLPDGTLLIAGGQDSGGRVWGTLSIENPLTGTITELNAQLRFPRVAHTTTVLPDGTVLVLGGVDNKGDVISSAEIFNPISQAVSLLITLSPTPRAFHTATLLTDGRVLVAGGVLANPTAPTPIELWDPRGQNSAVLASLLMDRRNHTATLQSDGRVLFAGGENKNGVSLSEAQIFDPQSQTLAILGAQSPPESGTALTEMRASSPEDGAQNVPLSALIAVRFSQPVLMASINGSTMTLQGPDGAVTGMAVAAEGGMLAFFTAANQLLPATTYVLTISGVVDAQNQSVAYAEFSFSTAGGNVQPMSDDEQWMPSSPTDWVTHRAPSKYASLPQLKAPKGITALTGQVLKLNGDPLAGVTLELGNQRTRSDSTGRFLLSNIPSGHQVLVIEGSTADTSSKKYGRFEFGDEIKAGTTNKLDFKIWMSQLDMAHEVTIPSPTVKETILTTPTMPGLELRLSAGTVITDEHGTPVTKITITPIPLDRPPIPLPFVLVPTFFTIQPGGAYISVSGKRPKGARLFYPNTEHKKAGIPYAFWNYNPDHNGWYVYGAGRVNQQGTQVVPDPGVVIYGFTGAMVGSGLGGPLWNPPPGPPSTSGDPVDLSSGLFVYNKADLELPDVIPINLTRTYRPNDSWSRPFGIGATHLYEMFIGGDGNAYGSTQYIDLILPSGVRIHFTGVGPGPNYSTYLHSSSNTAWYGAVISQPTPSVNYLQTRDGTTYTFPESLGLVNPGCQALNGITDRNGNQLIIKRNGDANCTIAQITSPNGRSIQFVYDSSYRITTATDNIGRQVQYSYDASGRLSIVTDANGGVWVYNYDSLNRMTTIEDPRQITYLTNVYDDNGMLQYQYQADGTSFYQFNWTTTSYSGPPQTTQPVFTITGGVAPYDIMAFRACNLCTEGYPAFVAQVSVTDPRGYTRQTVFNSDGYALSDTNAVGMPEQETTTYSYFPDNLLNGVTDQLGRATNYIYDINANRTSVTQLAGTSSAVTISMTYDSTFSNVLSITDPLNNITSLQYDTNGNATSVTDPLHHQTTFAYNMMGQVTSITDALQNTTQLKYEFGDLMGITDPMLNTFSMFHDGAGRLITSTDPLGHTVKYQYNNLDQPTQITDALQGITTLSYDPNGNPLTVQDARQQGTNNKTVYTYDNFDHLQTRTDPLLRQETYVVDPLGNLTSFTDRRGKVATFQYDGINRRIFAGYGVQAGPTYESTVSFAYDGGNRLARVVDSTSGTITPVFDGLNRLTSETTPQGSVSYQYDNDSHLRTVTVSGQPAVNYYYDNASRVYQVTQGSTNSLIGYDNANRRNSLTLPNGIVLTYGYDGDSRISSMNYQLGTTSIGNLTYQYDADGRRTQVGGSLAGTGFPQTVSSAAYDAANELTNWNGTTIGYDSNGNILNDGVAAYTWNARNQLISRASASFQYDAFGRRTLNAAGNNLLYEGPNPGQELSGGTPVVNRILGGIDEFFSRTDSTGNYSPITDGLGSVLALTNPSGTVTTQYSYDPYGNTANYEASTANQFQYTGRENDGNGLYFYRARYYSPSFGRFVSEDPARLRSGDTNFYAYAYNDPNRYRDPSGNDPIIGTIAGGAIGSFYGALGALSTGGNGVDIAEGALIGGAFGAGVGWLDPSFGLGVVLGGVTGGVGDAAGQWVTHHNHPGGGGCYNVDEIVGATVGGGLGGAVGAGLGIVGVSTSEEWSLALVNSFISGQPGYAGGVIGWSVGESKTAGRKGC